MQSESSHNHSRSSKIAGPLPPLNLSRNARYSHSRLSQQNSRTRYTLYLSRIQTAFSLFPRPNATAAPFSAHLTPSTLMATVVEGAVSDFKCSFHRHQTPVQSHYLSWTTIFSFSTGPSMMKHSPSSTPAIPFPSKIPLLCMHSSLPLAARTEQPSPT